MCIRDSESDYTPGLANRIAGRFADTICVTFEDTLEHLGKKRSAAVMAVNTSQNDWLLYMRPILMEELDMTREMVYTQSIIGDTYNYLNDIKWGPAQTVQVAIGQSITCLLYTSSAPSPRSMKSCTARPGNPSF